MENIWSFLLQTLSASVAALLLLLVGRLFRDKLSPRWQYGIWGVLALRLLLPAGLLGRVLLPQGRVLLEMGKLLAESPLRSTLTDPYIPVRVHAPIPLFPRGLPVPVSVTDLLFYLYAAGVVCFLLWFLCAYLRLRRRVGRGAPPTPQILAQVETVCAAHGLKPPRQISLCMGIEGAFVCGVLRPVLVLPAGGEPDEKVLLHELLHLRHGDVAAGVLLCILRCLHWCNPLLWHCFDRIQNDCEALCDQHVLERLEGEARRDYGRILLSMADERYARAPGTSSMANGGRNIKLRIAAIARFRRYPAGMGLASGCVALLLAVGCLWGASPSRTVPAQWGEPGLAQAHTLAQSILCRPTTVAGALDTYTKALLGGSPPYLAMVTPAGDYPALLGLPDGTALSSPFGGLGFAWVRTGGVTTYYADWRVFNLLPQRDGSYTGLLVFAHSNDAHIALSQPITVLPSGGGWVVRPHTPLAPIDTGGRWLLHSNPSLPAVTYTARAGNLLVALDYQYLLGVDNRIASSDPMDSFFGSSFRTESTPKPDALFTDYDHSVGGRVMALDTDTAVRLHLEYAPMTAEELAQGDANTALDDRARAGSITLPEPYGMGGGGGRDGRGVEDWQGSSPPAMAVFFRWEGQAYTLIALPEGGVPIEP